MIIHPFSPLTSLDSLGITRMHCLEENRSLFTVVRDKSTGSVFLGCEASDVFMGSNPVIGIGAPTQFVFPVRGGSEKGVLMPELRDRFDAALRLAVVSRRLGLHKTLFDLVLPTNAHEGMMLHITPILLSFVSVALLISYRDIPPEPVPDKRFWFLTGPQVPYFKQQNHLFVPL